MEPPRVTQARIAQNQSRFRDANEQIGLAADRQGLLRNFKIPIICECADASCKQIIVMSLNDYEVVRADSRAFITVPGHETALSGLSEVVGKRDGYEIVRKRSHAGDVAAALDEREESAPHSYRSANLVSDESVAGGD